MGSRKTINERRLTRAEVNALIDRATLHEQYTAAIRSGRDEGNLVYELPDDRFLLVFDPDGVSIPGKGDIWPGDAMRRLVDMHAQVEIDAAAGRFGSTDDWYHYSHLKERLVDHVGGLVAELAARVDARLDGSYGTLDRVSAAVESMGHDRAKAELYDHLVAYVGEVMRRRVDCVWAIDSASEPPYPMLLANGRHVLMPINVVHGEWHALRPVNLRKAAADEIRRTAFERKHC